MCNRAVCVNREGRRASCGYTPRSSWASLSGPGCPHRAPPACAWLRRRRSPAPGRRRTPRSSASAFQSPARRRAGRASRRWRCPAASAEGKQNVSDHDVCSVRGEPAVMDEQSLLMKNCSRNLLNRSSSPHSDHQDTKILTRYQYNSNVLRSTNLVAPRLRQLRGGGFGFGFSDALDVIVLLHLTGSRKTLSSCSERRDQPASCSRYLLGLWCFWGWSARLRFHRLRSGCSFAVCNHKISRVTELTTIQRKQELHTHSNLISASNWIERF